MALIISEHNCKLFSFFSLSLVVNRPAHVGDVSSTSVLSTLLDVLLFFNRQAVIYVVSLHPVDATKDGKLKYLIRLWISISGILITESDAGGTKISRSIFFNVSFHLFVASFLTFLEGLLRLISFLSSSNGKNGNSDLHQHVQGFKPHTVSLFTMPHSLCQHLTHVIHHYYPYVLVSMFSPNFWKIIMISVVYESDKF